MKNTKKKSHSDLRHSLKKFRYVDWIIDESVIFGAIHAVQRLKSSDSKTNQNFPYLMKRAWIVNRFVCTTFISLKKHYNLWTDIMIL